ncbi:MAG: hypothetical protein ABEI86_04400 [Halobacteriaceae archaeon]
MELKLLDVVDAAFGSRLANRAKTPPVSILSGICAASKKSTKDRSRWLSSVCRRCGSVTAPHNRKTGKWRIDLTWVSKVMYKDVSPQY